MKGTVYGNRLPTGTQVKKILGTTAVNGRFLGTALASVQQSQTAFTSHKTLNPPCSPRCTVRTFNSSHAPGIGREPTEGLNEIKTPPIWSQAGIKTQRYWRFNVGSFVLVATARFHYADLLFQSLAASTFESVSKFRCTIKPPSSEILQTLH